MSRHKLRPPGIRAIPEKVVLKAQEGSAFSGKPAVRIFIGSEAAQYRAERTLVWSIEQVRDPSRVYEIFLMKELKGFIRGKWLTGFTNYRFAIPAFAGQTGRAIYNDVDQIYLSDPGELFDHDLNGHGFLSIARNDSSVMVMDCTKMAKVWSLEEARSEKKNTLLQRALDVPNLWGRLGPEWNARDDEYLSGQSKVLHYTALHTQPWQPFPEQFVYQNSPPGKVWISLEEQANQLGYLLFTRSQPSSQFSELAAQIPFHSDPASTSPIQEATNLSDLDAHLAPQRIQTGLRCHLGEAEVINHGNDTTLWGEGSSTTILYNLLRQTPDSLPAQPFDTVFSINDLQHIPDEDIPWVLDEMFSMANLLVFVQIKVDERSSSNLQRSFDWWVSHFHAISKRYPHIHWKFVFRERQGEGNDRQFVRCGGHWFGHPPKIWILSDGKVGHITQSETLAKVLGWPYEVKRLRFHEWNRFQKVLWGILPPNIWGLDIAQSSPLSPPWPDIVINTGWRPAPVARWIREQSQEKTRIIQLGRKGGGSAALFDVVITPTYYGFPPHPHRIETLVPLNGLTKENLEAAGQRWPNLFGNAPHPRMVFVVGGSTARFTFTPEMAGLIGIQLKEMAENCHGKIFAVTSPRTGKDLVHALESALTPHHFIHKWQPNQSDNPYFAYLAGADMIIVTGESESMLAEAVSLGKPVYIVPLPENSPTWRVRLSERIVQRAHSQPLNKRGTARPQQGIERICARLIRTGLIQPRRNLHMLHESLITHGIARQFGEPIENGKRPHLNEIEVVAQKVQETLGIFCAKNERPPI